MAQARMQPPHRCRHEALIMEAIARGISPTTISQQIEDQYIGAWVGIDLWRSMRRTKTAEVRITKCVKQLRDAAVHKRTLNTLMEVKNSS